MLQNFYQRVLATLVLVLHKPFQTCVRIAGKAMSSYIDKSALNFDSSQNQTNLKTRLL